MFTHLLNDHTVTIDKLPTLRWKFETDKLLHPKTISSVSTEIIKISHRASLLGQSSNKNIIIQ
jgi:hypothetical protein